MAAEHKDLMSLWMRVSACHFLRSFSMESTNWGNWRIIPSIWKMPPLPSWMDCGGMSCSESAQAVRPGKLPLRGVWPLAAAFR